MPVIPNAVAVTITARTVADSDDRGNNRWTNGIPVLVKGCAVWPTTAAETRTQLADTVATGMSVLVPPGTVVDAYSLVNLGVTGEDWQVIGQPQVYRSPLTGTQAGTLLQLERVTG